ncbi:ribosome biogenesis GTPase A [Hypnocyclicus thermotrophus]|uniref:Ribosome biogenesis GTPase A n=1 Tax=Hypnocyclicus thermotrophus TaxID=1627895 RepID=A0AA46DYB4_9FUSO|nr:ribosome biogenesis GTPase YlqF [Hypnocyclicus thermotrophus]TDT69754.1 ribosome biogenesis GTPase A [Hypnocyclicus thermotrophus]
MSMTKINWYPGHMKKTKDMINENMKIIDIVLEIVDARIPLSSKNPDIPKFAKNKKRLLLLNKSDLVEKEEINRWKKYFKENNMANEVLEISAETGYNIKKVFSLINELSKEKVEKMKKKGLRNVNVRIIVAGIPNVGKSKLINRIVGKNSAGVGNKPGFTKGKQWIRIKQGVELLDTPGILWPRFENEFVGYSLAIAGAIKDEILPIEEVAQEFIKRIKQLNKEGIFIEKYRLEKSDINELPEIILQKVAKNLGMLQKGEKLDTLQAAYKILRDYRACNLGKFVIDIENNN